MSADIAKQLLSGVKEHWPTWRHLNYLWPLVGKKSQRNRQTDR